MAPNTAKPVNIAKLILPKNKAGSKATIAKTTVNIGPPAKPVNTIANHNIAEKNNPKEDLNSVSAVLISLLVIGTSGEAVR